jgi:hypothetical protein
MPTDMAACTVSSARPDALAFNSERRRRTGKGAGLTTTQLVADLPVFFSNIESSHTKHARTVAALNGRQS